MYTAFTAFLPKYIFLTKFPDTILEVEVLIFLGSTGVYGYSSALC